MRARCFVVKASKHLQKKNLASKRLSLRSPVFSLYKPVARSYTEWKAPIPKLLQKAVDIFSSKQKIPASVKPTKTPMELVREVPAIIVHGRIAACDGGGGPLGHPRVFLKLDRADEPGVCGYCSLRFIQESNLAAYIQLGKELGIDYVEGKDYMFPKDYDKHAGDHH